jgi:urease accessory protein
VHGFFNGAALERANSSSLAVGGIVCAAFVVVALLAGQVASLQTEWARIMVRVAGSWIGAIGLLMLGWAAR